MLQLHYLDLLYRSPTYANNDCHNSRVTSIRQLLSGHTDADQDMTPSNTSQQLVSLELGGQVRNIQIYLELTLMDLPTSIYSLLFGLYWTIKGIMINILD